MYEELIEALRLCVKYGKAEDALTNASQAADAIEKLGDWWAMADKLIKMLEMPRWIPVTERLPELHEEVLVCNEEYGLSGLGFATVAVWDGTDWIETWDRSTAIHCVTHWMPLPEPPKEETLEGDET